MKHCPHYEMRAWGPNAGFICGSCERKWKREVFWRGGTRSTRYIALDADGNPMLGDIARGEYRGPAAGRKGD
jgi:hypothetical protein